MSTRLVSCFFFVFVPAWTTVCLSQQLEQQLLAESPASLAADAKASGDAVRGAIVFHQPQFACAKCHSVSNGQASLGPNLAIRKAGEPVPSDTDLVDGVLRPSATVRKAYEMMVVLTTNGVVHNGLLSRENDNVLVLKDGSQFGKLLTIRKADIEAVKTKKTSLMPAGQVNQLSGRQQFLDLVKYLMEIRDGGATRALELQPPAHLLVAPPIPDYEATIDHAGLIAEMDDQSLKRGEAIYSRLCINCHGTKDQPGSLPTSLRFASGKFKNGSDPYAMYQTLTRGFGMMLPQTWMVPQQKYDVIHYVRSEYLKKHNASQHFDITDRYLASLPKGDSRGPAPSQVEAWVNMDYGPSMINTFEVGKDGKNFAYKGIAVRLDAGPGGVSRGNAWMIFDHDTMRMSAAWAAPESSGASPFIDWQGIHFNGRHNSHPRISGQVHLANPTGPGWASPNPDDAFLEDPRLVGRDGRKYGPLPSDWAKLNGIYSHGPATIIDYQIGTTHVTESPSLLNDTNAKLAGDTPTFARTFNIGPRDTSMSLVVGSLKPGLKTSGKIGNAIVLEPKEGNQNERKPFSFNGGSYLQVADGEAFDMTDSDFTITARVRTDADGTIFAKTANDDEWTPNGKAFFIRGGRLAYDIGWVGAAKSKKNISDGKWHDVAMTWKTSGEVNFYVDGKPNGGGKLKPKAAVSNHAIRIGFTAANFPAKPHFDGDLQDVRFIGRALTPQQVKRIAKTSSKAKLSDLVACWPLAESDSDSPGTDTAGKYGGEVVRGRSVLRNSPTRLAFGTSKHIPGLQWTVSSDNPSDGGNGLLFLQIPPGKDPLKFVLWSRSSGLDRDAETAEQLTSVQLNDESPDLSKFMHGGPPRWPERLTTTVVRGEDDGPFAIDTLAAPSSNPWQARVRLTGHDFYDDGDRMAVSSWDGDVWMVSGLSKIDESGEEPVKLIWQRIASGLFQPLGLRIVDGKIYVSCRDQICVLHDLNADGETDFYQCFNRDHQVTEHFHEFAMGLQRDAEGNFYYAKSARHAKTALVPHHGTLLRVSKDGSKTDILANGFRAANGVCLNPDGTFIVTDQEGHWNPKNRINWVEPGGFYGNMFGYHDVSDSADSAMSQPLCWITNAFDRSPAELLWVDSEKWGPLNKRLLNLSYGYGKVYVVPHEEVNGQKQGGMCQLPIPQFPTGTMRGRFRKEDGQLYVCGMFAWGSAQQQQEGGLYRIRRTEKPVHLPVELSATQRGMTLGFSDKLNRASAEKVSNYAIKVWSLKRTANYGSKHYDEHALAVQSAKLAEDGKTVTLVVPDIAPTWCMEIRYDLQSVDNKPINGTIHNTIHNLND